MTPDRTDGERPSLAELEQYVDRQGSERVMAIVTPLLVVLLVIMAAAFWFLPTGRTSSAIVFASAGVVAGIGALARWGRPRLAAALFAVVAIGIPAVEPASTANLSTNAFFVGIACVLGLLVIERRHRWIVIAASAASLVVMVVASSPEATPPIGRDGILVSGAALIALVLMAAYFLLRAFTEMAQRAAAAQRVATSRAQALTRVNEGLAAAIEQRALELTDAIDARRQLAQRLQDSVVRDPLTGLLNRRYLDENIGRFVTSPAAVAILDVDSFKPINDRLSYSVGDQVLVAIASVLAQRSRDGDVVVRYGGEEFALLMPSTDAETAFAVVEDLRAAIDEYNWNDVHAGLRVTVSAGICTADPQVATPHAAMSEDERSIVLLQRADQALHRAKELGRNRSILVRT